MLRNVFTKSLRDQRWALLGWSIGVVLLVVLESFVWPTLRDMPNVDELMAGYPDAMKEMFDLEAMTTAIGFMNAELFTLVLPMLFIIFGVSRGARMVAGEEEAGTLEFMLITPVSPIRFVLHKAAALAASVAVLGVVLFVTLWASSAAFGMGISAAHIATGALAMVLLGIEFGCLALAVGAATGRRGLALGVGGTAAVAAYVLHAMALIVDSMEPWGPLSPFQQALADGPLGAAPPLSIGWIVLGAAVFVAAALPVFDRRDLRVH